MPPKKVKKEDPNGPAEDCAILEQQIKKYQNLIAREQNRADECKQKKIEQDKQIIDLDKDFKLEQVNLDKITSDMSRQYNQLQDELQGQVNENSKKIQQRDKQIKQLKDSYQQKTEEHKKEMQQKEEEVNNYKRQMEEMITEFSKMLKDTLDKMQERIEFVQWDNDKDEDKIIHKKIKDVTG